MDLVREAGGALGTARMTETSGRGDTTAGHGTAGTHQTHPYASGAHGVRGRCY